MHSVAIDIYLGQYAATLFMTGLIWFVQVVHYPLFATVHEGAASSGFRTYATRHADRTSFVVFPPMAVELLTAITALLPSLRPVFLSKEAAILSAILVLFIWLSTGLIQVPLHNRLSGNATQPTIRRLVLSNWLRTALWSARAVLLSTTLLNGS